MLNEDFNFERIRNRNNFFLKLSRPVNYNFTKKYSDFVLSEKLKSSFNIHEYFLNA